MHISEGVLSAPILISGGAVTLCGTIVGLRRLDTDRIMTVSMLTSAFFVASLIHVPIGPASIHLVLNGLLGILLGWASFPAILVGLLMQAIFFQYGGLVVLGVNAANMAVPALVVYYLVRPLMKRGANEPRFRMLAGFIGGCVAVLLSALCMALSLAFSDAGFLTTAKITVVANVPVMIIEGLITMFVVSFISRVHPDLLMEPCS